MHGPHVFDGAARAFVIACLIFGAAACKANFPESPTPSATLVGIQVHYNNPHQSVLVGNVVSLTLYALDSEGIFENVTSRASWLSVNPEIAAVSPGVARGQRGGITDVIVSYGGFTTTARIVVVVPGQVLTTLVLQTPPQLLAGQTAQARAWVGTTEVTQQTEWASSDARVFTVSDGILRAVGPGTAALTATRGALSQATAYISVPPIRSVLLP